MYENVLTVAAIFDEKDFIYGVCRRGIPWTGTHKGLETRQMMAIQAVIGEKGTLKDRLKKCGVSYGLWTNWMKDKTFRSYFESLGADALSESIPVMKTVLAQQAEKGDLNAIKFAFEVTGEYNPAREGAIEVQAVLAQVIEIISKHVLDPDVLTRIGFELSAVAGRSGITGQSPPIQGELSGDVYNTTRVAKASGDRPSFSLGGLERKL